MIPVEVRLGMAGKTDSDKVLWRIVALVVVDMVDREFRRPVYEPGHADLASVAISMSDRRTEPGVELPRPRSILLAMNIARISPALPSLGCFFLSPLVPPGSHFQFGCEQPLLATQGRLRLTLKTLAHFGSDRRSSFIGRYGKTMGLIALRAPLDPSFHGSTAIDAIPCSRFRCDPLPIAGSTSHFPAVQRKLLAAILATPFGGCDSRFVALPAPITRGIAANRSTNNAFLLGLGCPGAVPTKVGTIVDRLAA